MSTNSLLLSTSNEFKPKGFYTDDLDVVCGSGNNLQASKPKPIGFYTDDMDTVCGSRSFEPIPQSEDSIASNGLFISSDDESPCIPLSVNVSAGIEDGPEGYHYFGPYPDIKQYVSDTEQRRGIVNSFMNHSTSHQTVTWGHEVVMALGSFIGTFSSKPLGNGANSNVFLLTQEQTGQKLVFRAFQVFNLRHPHLQKAFQINREHVGGEWISATLNHPTLAHNTHVIAWDSFDKSFKIMDQKQVQDLIDNHHLIAEGRQVYAVATLGDFVSGSTDLEAVLMAQPKRTEDEIRSILYNIFQGVAEMNRNQVVHRDLKASNILILPSGAAKIIDFGSAAFCQVEETLPFHGDRRIQPAESFLEIDEQPVHTSQKTDPYSIFLLTYHALTGENFFRGEITFDDYQDAHRKLYEEEKVSSFRSILEKDPKLEGISSELIDLMAAIGSENEKSRITAQQALEHPFFSHHVIKQVFVDNE